MKPFLKIIHTQPSNPFRLMHVHEPHFFHSWHFHPECEIMLVLEGTGIRFVGDSMERFQPGDLVFLGSNIPHFYRSDDEYYSKGSGLISKAVVFYFRENFLGEVLWGLGDISPLKKLFADSKRGIRFRDNVKDELTSQLKRFDEHKDDLSRVIALLSILQTMIGPGGYQLLSSSGFTHSASEGECERMNTVYKYIIDNYKDDPGLQQVSKLANMSIPAFCRYFKSRTNKTYTQFLNEIKIGSACKLLIDNRLSVSQICFEAGFNNFTHFNSQFRRIMGTTPTQYQHQHQHPVLDTVPV